MLFWGGDVVVEVWARGSGWDDMLKVFVSGWD